MMADFKFEVLDHWDETAKLKNQWNELILSSGVPHPFTTYEWFNCWYRAYCRPGDERIIVLRDGQGLRAILPGMIRRMKIGGVPLTIFSNAANGHSPRADILSTPNDTEALIHILSALPKHLPEKIHLIMLLTVEADSSIEKIIKENAVSKLYPYCEHNLQSPGFGLSNGWEKYFQSRSKKIRFRFRQGENRAKSMGALKFEPFSSRDDLRPLIERLKLLEVKTWQYKQGSGLFSTAANEAFYRGLLENYAKDREVVISFLTIGGVDAAYELGVLSGSKAYFLKYGFDPEFEDCRPGVLVQTYLSQYVASLGCKEIDLGLEQSEEKAHWQTQVLDFKNYWLIRKNTLRGNILIWGIGANRIFKKVADYKNRSFARREDG